MKQIYLLFFMLYFNSLVNAQDIITKKSGEIINAKIIFEDELAIKYKKFDDPNGPQYLVLIRDIRNVLKEDGTIINGTSFSSNTPHTSTSTPTITNTSNNLPKANTTGKGINTTEKNTITSIDTPILNTTIISENSNSVSIQAFDIIFKKTGEEIKANIIEVGTSDITYKKQENLTGPNYKISNADVMMIKYKNGTNEVIKTEENLKATNINSVQTTNTIKSNTDENNYTKFDPKEKNSSTNGTIFNYSLAKHVFDNHESEIRIFAAMGIKPLRTLNQTIEFEYIDESPSRDHIYELFDIRKNIYSGSFRLGAEYQLKQNVFFKGLFDFYFGKIGGVSFDIGGGYAFEFNKFKLRPQVLFSFGYTSIKLGDIEQNDTWIDVNTTRFYSPSVEVKLRSNQVIFNPQLELAYRISKRIALDLDLGYNIALSKGAPYVYFSGEDIDNKSVSAKESIKVPNMYLAIDNIALKTQNIKFGYPTAHLGISFCIN